MDKIQPCWICDCEKCKSLPVIYRQEIENAQCSVCNYEEYESTSEDETGESDMGENIPPTRQRFADLDIREDLDLSSESSDDDRISESSVSLLQGERANRYEQQLPNPIEERELDTDTEEFITPTKEFNGTIPTPTKIRMAHMEGKRNGRNRNVQLGRKARRTSSSSAQSTPDGIKKGKRKLHLTDTDTSEPESNTNNNKPRNKLSLKRRRTTKDTTDGRRMGTNDARHTGDRLGSTYGGESSKTRISPDETEWITRRQDDMDQGGLDKNKENQPMEEDEEGPWYTFIIHEKPEPRVGRGGPTFTCTDHGDHWHITFKCTANNKSRSRNNICKFLGLTIGARAEAEGSTVLVKSIRKWILYLIRFGIERVKYFGYGHTLFRKIIEYFKGTNDSVDGPCPYMENKRQERKEETMEARSNEFEYLEELVQTKNPRTVHDLVTKLTRDEFQKLYCVFKGNYRDKLKAIIMFYNKENQRKEKERPLMQNLDLVKKREPNDNHIEWIEYLLKENNIDIAEFFAWAQIIVEAKLNKVNTLVLQGPTGTGKSLLLNSLLNRFNTAIITRNGDQNQFHLQNLLGKSYGLFEEPRISQITVDDYKLLLEGAEFEINVKHQEPEMLPRVTIFISTNKELDYWVPPEDGQALYTRTKTFLLKKPIKGLGDKKNSQYAIDPPPGRITPDDIRGIYIKYKKDIHAIIQRIA